MMGFSMGNNFLNSPGAALLHAIGVNMPGYVAQHPANPQPMQGGGFAGADFSAPPPDNVSYQAPPLGMQVQPIPQPPHGGLLHRILSAVTGGVG